MRQLNEKLVDVLSTELLIGIIVDLSHWPDFPS